MDSYICALLSEAAYAELEGVDTSAQLINALVKVNGELYLNKGFCQIQDEDSICHWRVAHHLPSTSTEFSVTVFQSLDNSDEFALKLRHTEQ
ncbi:MAG: hypothetical protein JAY84_03530 [Candidatus Thiodiazotropha taylori]|nr:hypothetical protein [Candidatus Thiodiazotropha taylori]